MRHQAPIYQVSLTLTNRVSILKQISQYNFQATNILRNIARQNIKRFSHTFIKLDMSAARRYLKSPRSLPVTSTTLPTMVTHRSRSWSWMIDSQPLCPMSIGPPIPKIMLFQCLPLNIQDQSHGSKGKVIWPTQYPTELLPFSLPCGRGQNSWPYSWPSIQLMHLLLISGQSHQPFIHKMGPTECLALKKKHWWKEKKKNNRPKKKPVESFTILTHCACVALRSTYLWSCHNILLFGVLTAWGLLLFRTNDPWCCMDTYDTGWCLNWYFISCNSWCFYIHWTNFKLWNWCQWHVICNPLDLLSHLWIDHVTTRD